MTSAGSASHLHRWDQLRTCCVRFPAEAKVAESFWCGSAGQRSSRQNNRAGALWRCTPGLGWSKVRLAVAISDQHVGRFVTTPSNSSASTLICSLIKHVSSPMQSSPKASAATGGWPLRQRRQFPPGASEGILPRPVGDLERAGLTEINVIVRPSYRIGRRWRTPQNSKREEYYDLQVSDYRSGLGHGALDSLNRRDGG